LQFGTNMTAAAPGSAQGTYLVVSDIGAARDDLVAHGVEPSDVFHAAEPGAQFGPEGGRGRVSGPAPENASYSSFLTFQDPDGNGWLLQEITSRLPGRLDPAETTFASAADLAGALRRAIALQGDRSTADSTWADAVAAAIIAEQAGAEPS